MQRLPILTLTLLVIACYGCSSREPASAPSPAQQDMLEILATIAELTDELHPFLGNREARQLETDLARAMQDGCTPTVAWGLQYESGIAQIRLGNVKLGIQRLEAARAVMSQVDFVAAARDRLVPPRPSGDIQAFYENSTRFYLGIAYLRQAETENCCQRHSSESCILPIRGAGIHTDKTGSTKAVQCFTEVLDNWPDRTSPMDELELKHAARWLLNIAYMTLGEFPGGVPEPYRLPESFFRSEVEFPRFKNVAPSLGLNTFNLCGGAIVDDFDNDDYLDIVTCTWDTRGQMRLFRNQQDGTFSDRTEAAGLTGFFGGLNMVHADFDNDGDPDLFVLRGAWLRSSGRHPNSLLRNNGDGTFTDVTFAAGLGEFSLPTKTAAWADYDNDGHLDLFIGNESTDDMPAPCQLFHNNGDGTFTDVAPAAGVAARLFAMGVVWGDYNGDRFPDLYVSTGISSLTGTAELKPPANRLYRNNGDGTFEEVAKALRVDKPWSGFPAWFWDFNNDGHLDLYASCSAGPVGVLASDIRLERNCLYQGDGRGNFTDVAVQQGLTYPAQPMGANFGDLNNDGYPDFYLATGNIQYSEVRPNVMMLNRSGQRFVNVTMAGGFGHLQKGHGVSFADLDNDGDQDIYVQMGGAWPGDKFKDALFENPGFGHHWLTIQLIGRQSNRSAIGARIRVDITEDGKQRSVYRHVSSGGSFGGNPLRQTIGLGTAESIDAIEIFWPTTNRKQTLQGVAVDQTIKVVEGQDGFTSVPLKTLRLGGDED